jgi:uncharacterized surface protein with fasciclin (FAS1) repeats
MSAQDQETKGLGTGPIRDKNAVHDLWDTLQANGHCSRFLRAAGEAQLEDILHGPEWLTVFAVPDEALTNESDESLRVLVRQHVVRGLQKEADLRHASSLCTVEGPPIQVPFDLIQRADIACSNGMIHMLRKPIRECAYSG